MSDARGAPATQLIWLTDLHFEADALVLGHDPRQRLRAAVDHINANYRYPETEICVITGDMVDTPTPENYAALWQELDRLQLPWVPLTGNHDDRQMFLQHLPQPAGLQQGFAQSVVDLDGARAICLDTLWEGHDAGLLCPDRLAWLEAQLEACRDRPVMLFMHHPPIDLGLPMLDPDRLSNGGDLMACLARYPQVRQVCCGHVHRPVTAQVGNITLSSLRAVLYQAPAPRPAWDWDSFSPPREAPELGVICIEGDQVTLQREAFCAYEDGGPA